MADTGLVPPVDLALLEQLWSDRTPWEIPDIRAELDITAPKQVNQWRTAQRNYTECGLRVWPPDAQMQRSLLPVAEGAVPDPVEVPPHPSVLPPPDGTSPSGRPVWFAGTIRRWAMQVGRLTLRGQPATWQSAIRRGRTPAAVRPDLGDLDRALWSAVLGDRRRWRVADLADLLGQDIVTVRVWARATRNYLNGGETSWPPEYATRVRIGPVPVTVWPPHANVLPPPDEVDEDGRSAWQVGTLLRWAMQVGRISPMDLPDITLQFGGPPPAAAGGQLDLWGEETVPAQVASGGGQGWAMADDANEPARAMAVLWHGDRTGRWTYLGQHDGNHVVRINGETRLLTHRAAREQVVSQFWTTAYRALGVTGPQYEPGPLTTAGEHPRMSALLWCGEQLGLWTYLGSHDGWHLLDQAEIPGTSVVSDAEARALAEHHFLRTPCLAEESVSAGS